MGILIRDLLARRDDTTLHTIGRGDTVQEALEKMAEHRISSLPVLDGDTLAGIVSERDYVRKLVPRRIAPWDAGVEEIMTAEVLTIAPDTSLEECMRLMSEKRIRHLPVMEGGSLIGMISISDVVTAMRPARHAPV